MKESGRDRLKVRVLVTELRRKPGRGRGEGCFLTSDIAVELLRCPALLGLLRAPGRLRRQRRVGVAALGVGDAKSETSTLKAKPDSGIIHLCRARTENWPSMLVLMASVILFPVGIPGHL